MKRALGITLDIAWVADHNIKDFYCCPEKIF